MSRAVLTPTQAAARWLAQEDLDQSPQREQFAAWLDDSQAHRDAWAQVSQMWDVFDDADDSDLIAALARAARQAGPEPIAKPFWPQLVAASLAIVVASATLFVGAKQGWFDRSTRSTDLAVNAPSSLAALGRADYVTGQGQKSIIDLPDGTTTSARVRAVTPTLSGETRAATAVLDVIGGRLQPGLAVRVRLFPSRGGASSAIVVPEEAVQSLNARDVVFVRTPKGFKAVPVTTGQRSAGRIEIVSGLAAGQTIATKNAFLLKAELGKGAGEEE